MKERVCEGYVIQHSQRIGGVEIVLGHNPKAPQPYVTWKAYSHTNYENFAYGHYFTDLHSAQADFDLRVEDAWRNFTPYRPPRPNPQKGTKKRGDDRGR